MRVRKKQYCHYGLTDERVRELMEYCRNNPGDELIKKAAEVSSPGLASYLVRSLTVRRCGYDAQMKWVYIPATKADFYAYRRRMVAILNVLLLLRELEIVLWVDTEAEGQIKPITR